LSYILEGRVLGVTGATATLDTKSHAIQDLHTFDRLTP
jgi:hypothetical protein